MDKSNPGLVQPVTQVAEEAKVNARTYRPVYATTVPAGTFNLNGCQWVTATVRTGGSTYVVVARPTWGVTVTCATTVNDPSSRAPKAGETMRGAYLAHQGTTLSLHREDGTCVWRATRVTDVTVHEN